MIPIQCVFCDAWLILWLSLIIIQLSIL